MRVPIEWLADYVALELSTEDLAHRLTMAGLKVDSIDRIGADWQDVVVGQVVELEVHPSPKLKKPMNVARVDIGTDTLLTVVTGAQNVRRGDKVALVPVGGTLPHGPDGEVLIIGARPMFGITSEGMLASERELGISDEHSGIMVLPPDAPVGQPLRTILGGDVLDIETNPNRPDTLSMVGIAREVAAITEQQLTLPNQGDVPGEVEWIDVPSITVTVEAPELCARYSALRIEGVRVEPSPPWVARRLEAAGMRPINLLVDLSNYVMLEIGQPMHAFDAGRLHGGEIIVRCAREGEELRTLDGNERFLSPHNLVIADRDRAVAVAGVMGGEDSEITEKTSTVILESANFEGSSVRRTAQALGVRTESSSRFEKGLPPETTALGIERYLQLLAQVGGRPLRVFRMTDVAKELPPSPTVTMPLMDLQRLLGIEIPAQIAAEKLSLLGFDVSLMDGSIRATVPPWRRGDVGRSADLVEEVARLVGYDAIPSTLPRRTMEPAAPLPALHYESLIRERLLSLGVSEATTHTLTALQSFNWLGRDDHPASEHLVPNVSGVYEHEALVDSVTLLNPATTERKVLRLSLVPGLLDVISRNLKHTEEHLAFFELDTTFFARPAGLPYERRTLAIALAGRREPRSWQTPEPDQYGFYDLKGMLENVLLGLQIQDWTVQATYHPALHSGRAAALQAAGRDIGYFGQLHPFVADRFDLRGRPALVAEVDLDALFPYASSEHVYVPLARFPAARRDIAVVVGRDTPAEEVVSLVRAAGGDILEHAEIFDIFRGEPLQDDEYSIAVAMEFRSPGATLTQEEVGQAMQQIVDRLSAGVGARLRE